MSNGKEIKVSADDLLSVQEAAKELARPRITLYRWIQKGALHGIRLGGVLFVPRSEVERLKRSSARALSESIESVIETYKVAHNE